MAKHPGMLTDLTEVEQKLIDSARRGDVLVCSALNHDQLRAATDPGLLVRGEVVRELLLGRHGELDPLGVRVEGARITGEFHLNYVTADRGLELHRCVVDQPARLSFASLPWLTVTNTHLPELDAQGIRVEGNVVLRGIVVLSSARADAVSLMDAQIGGGLDMRNARLSSRTNSALNVGRMRVVGSVFFNGQFTATGKGKHGAVDMVDARVGSELNLSSASLTNASGPALHANGVRVDSHMFLHEKFSATGMGKWGAVNMIGARIGGEFHLTDADLVNPQGPVLKIPDAQTGLVILHIHLICPRGRTTGRTCPDSDRWFHADGFVYADIDRIDIEWRQWLHLLRCHTAGYAPMPYQQLAAIRTAAGHDRDARRILIVQQQDHRARGNIGGPLRRATHALWGALAGYGYRTGRTALALLVVLLLAGGMGWWAGHTETAPSRHAAEHPTKLTACSPVELVGLGIDRGLPLASTGIRARCDLDTASIAGQWFTVAIWLLQAAVWALATLALAGYTGLVRKIR